MKSYVSSFINDTTEIEKFGDLWFQIAERYIAVSYQEENEKSEDERKQYLAQALDITTKLLDTDRWKHLLVQWRHANALEGLGTGKYSFDFHSNFFLNK